MTNSSLLKISDSSDKLHRRANSAPWRWLLTLVLLAAALAARAEVTLDPATASAEGHELAQKILAQLPAGKVTNTGTLEIRDATRKTSSVSIKCVIGAGGADWSQTYLASFPAGTETLTVTRHAPSVDPSAPTNTAPNLIFSDTCVYCPSGGQPREIPPEASNAPFAGSDFSVADLRLGFLYWPRQKIIKKEFRRQCPCLVLESTNPHPAAGGYRRVVSWIDEESLGLVEAHAYDSNNLELKYFYPKNLEKVNGQYQLESMVIENVQTRTKSTFEFDLHK
jgi:hypothetical protein